MATGVVALLAWGALRGWDGLGGDRGNGTAEARAATVVDRAEELLEAGRIEEAVSLLTPVVRPPVSPAVGPPALLTLARAEQMAGRTDAALAHLKRAVEEFPRSPVQPRAAVAWGKLLEETGRVDEARALYERVRQEAPPGIRAPAIAGLGRLAEREGDLLVARDLYRAAVADARWDSPEWREAVDELGKANVALIFSNRPTPESATYSVEKGDNLTSISYKLNITQGLLTRANGIDETTPLDVGQLLKYTPKDFRIVVDRSRCRLYLCDTDGVFKLYPAGLRMEERETPLGSFTIGNKEKGSIPDRFGDEDYTRWMPLMPTREGLPRNLGIHDARDLDSVGQYTARGSIALRPADVEELFDLVVRGTPVDIVEEYGPETRS